MSKYYSRKVTMGGAVFDSKKEAQRWCELSLLQKAGKITNLQRQVKYELIPSQKIDGKVVERACTYVADHTYFDKEGVFHCEDVKGYKNSTAYQLFVIKRKLMLKLYGIKVEEI